MVILLEQLHESYRKLCSHWQQTGTQLCESRHARNGHNAKAFIAETLLAILCLCVFLLLTKLCASPWLFCMHLLYLDKLAWCVLTTLACQLCVRYAYDIRSTFAQHITPLHVDLVIGTDHILAWANVTQYGFQCRRGSVNI